MRQRYRWSLRVRLLIVVLAALLPIAVLLLWLWTDARQRDRQDSLRSLRQTTEAVAVIADTPFDEGFLMAEGLAVNPLVQTLDPAIFGARLQEFHQQLRRFRRLLVIDASGNVVGWSTREPLPPPVANVADRRFFQHVMQTGTPTTIRGAVALAPEAVEIGVAVPILGADGVVRGVFAIQFDLDAFSRRLADVQLFPGQVVSLVDPNGRVAVILGAPEVSVEMLTAEQRASGNIPEIRAALAGQTVVTDDFVGPLLGQTRLAAFVPTPHYGWVVTTTWPTEAAAAGLRQAQQRELAIFIAIVLTILSGAVVASRALMQPLRQLNEHARRLGTGQFAPIPESRVIPEVGELIATFNDMGAQLQQTMAELQEREGMVRALLDQFPASVSIIDADLRYVLAAGRRIVDTGLPADALIGKTLDQLYSETLVSLAREHANIALRGQETSYVVTEGGVCLNVTMIPLRAADGTVPHILTISFDVTAEREQRERTVRDEKLHALGQMAGGIAHNLNQTLALVTGYGELVRAALDQTPQDTSELRRMIRIIERAAYDGGETVKRLLTFARGQTNEQMQGFDMSEMLREVAQLTAPRWRERTELDGSTVDLRVNASTGLCVQGVQSGLREAVTNLVFNALDAMPHGGTIDLSARREGPNVVVEVTDTGEGMTEDVQRRIFEPFFTTKGTNGTGLGLAMVFGIVRRHGGEVDVISAPGSGTTMRMTLPADDHRTVAPPPVLGEAPGKTYRIVVVDDEERLAALAAGMLRRDGHTVTEAHSGEQTLALLRAEPCDLVISDLSMGDGMNGWELARAIGSEFPHVPVILVTGWGAAIDEAEARSQGVMAVLPKPFRMADLREAISRVMEATVSTHA